MHCSSSFLPWAFRYLAQEPSMAAIADSVAFLPFTNFLALTFIFVKFTVYLPSALHKYLLLLKREDR